jgi:hypothetical protein
VASLSKYVALNFDFPHVLPFFGHPPVSVCKCRYI